MQDLKTIVLSNQEISPGYYRMKILASGYSESAKPGQFVMLRVQRSFTPLLRRPFGVFQVGFIPADCDTLPPKEFIELVYKVVGGGTETMRELQSGDAVELLGPLGSGFTADASIAEKILVGGGIGLVPLYMLATELVKTSKVSLFVGGRTRDDIITISEFERLGVNVSVATEDGSLGETGFVTRLLEQRLEEPHQTEVFACGPMPMLDAVQKICATSEVSLQVSLEALMACGVGACLGCVVKGEGHTINEPRYLCSCTSGPVFNAESLDWNKTEAIRMVGGGK
ncbi:MAG: dihydroorotate dehydrogenase electron transfer subunit, partial [Desulfuromonadales bacterium]|nr:dihydroorotate dehydrogenase electron transfer subunit [Desulfuromonadales bacterium]